MRDTFLMEMQVMKWAFTATMILVLMGLLYRKEIGFHRLYNGAIMLAITDMLVIANIERIALTEANTLILGGMALGGIIIMIVHSSWMEKLLRIVMKIKR